MNEITRIHIAKVPYEIEVGAKKKLEAYITALEAYTEESDWLQDIEIRMTEILEERGVKRNELITSDEVAAIREQLGEPEDFYGEGDIAVGAQQHGDAAPSRRLYRDPSTAMLAGVLSGMAHYLKISPIWTRLAFLVLLFVSFGTVVVVYIVLWVAIPPADSVASQIELKGKSVTLATLKAHRSKIGGNGEISKAARITRSALAYSAGTFAAIAALGTLIFTTWVVFGLSSWPVASSVFEEVVPNTFNAWVGFALLALSGVLLSALFSIIAIVCFTRSLKKKMGVAIIAIVIAGIVSFGTGVAFTAFSQAERYAAIEASRKTETVKLGDEFKVARGISVGSAEAEDDEQHYDFIAVKYIVSDRAPRYEITKDSETKSLAPSIVVDESGEIKVLLKDAEKRRQFFTYTQHPSVTIYGPALESIKVLSGRFEYQAKGAQDKVAVELKSGQLTLGGAYVDASASVDGGDFDAQNASIDNLTLAVKSGSVATGVIRTLSLTQPEACPASFDSEQSRVAIQAIASARLTFNGHEKDAKSFTHLCGKVIIGNPDEETLEPSYL